MMFALPPHRSALIPHAVIAAALVSALFLVFPELDVAISGLFFEEGRWIWRRDPVLEVIRDALWLLVPWGGPMLLAVIALKFLWPRWRALIDMKVAVFLVTCMLVGPGFITNVVLKDSWGRPRPSHITEFGNDRTFIPVWVMNDQCPKNCSFICGECAAAASLLALALVAAGRLRFWLLWHAGLWFAVMGTIRLIQGSHFMSDVLLGGLIMYLTMHGMHGLFYRWAPAWFTGAWLEQKISQISPLAPKTLN